MSAHVTVLRTQQGSFADELPEIVSALNAAGLSRGAPDVEMRTRKVVTENHSSSSSACPVHIRLIGATGGPCTCDLAAILRGVTGHTANSDYMSQVNVPSQWRKAESPLLVISLDGVIEAELPDHIRGGYTDVLSRPYLQTLMKYLLLQSTPWCFVFYTSKPRKEGLKILKELNLPTGGPEDDERDGVLGLFAAEDMTQWSGCLEPVKDLEKMWQVLYEEEGVHFGVHNTVVLSHNPHEMAKQPHNFIHVPKLKYRSTTAASDDMFLLLMISILKELETSSNFAYHIREMEYNETDLWISTTPNAKNERNRMLANAVKICAVERISIRAFTGNKRDAA